MKLRLFSHDFVLACFNCVLGASQAPVAVLFLYLFRFSLVYYSLHTLSVLAGLHSYRFRKLCKDVSESELSETESASKYLKNKIKSFWIQEIQDRFLD